jgi:hypothetical protein
MIAKGEIMTTDRTDTTTLTLRDTPYTLIQTAKRLTGKATGSQAFLAGIAKLDELTDQVEDLREEIRRLRENLRRSQTLLQQLAPLCIQVAEVAGQKDLFE